MWVVLQPKVCLRESYWDMRPSCPEASALADVGDCSEIFFPLLLRLMNWFVGSSGDGIDDVLTLLPEGVSIARSGICPGSSFGGGGRFVVSQDTGVELLDHV